MHLRVFLSSSDACELALDPNTANKNLYLAQGNRKVTMAREEKSYPDHPERFDSWFQVLCRESLTGRCYWEVERKASVHIGVTYKGFGRSGRGAHSKLGGNRKSWNLVCTGNNYCAWHDSLVTLIGICSSPISERIGVYLDWPDGTLFFYKVHLDTLSLLHTFHARFTEPLHPGFGLEWVGSSVFICQT